MRAILAAVADAFSCSISHAENDTKPHANAIAYKQLFLLLKGVTERGEGNSCLIIGPRGSGKSEVQYELNEHPLNLYVIGAQSRSGFP